MGTVDEQLLDYWSSASQYVTDFRFKANVTPLAFWELAIGSSILYLVTIYLLRKYMETREKYEIRVFAMLHNFNMFAISVFCWLGLTYGFLKAFYDAGSLEVLFCDAKDMLTKNGPLQFWQYIFWISKLYELLDTVILCLRKSDIIFLHVYHHWVTNLLVFWSLYFEVVSAWSATSLNALVHIPMYLYYWLSIAGFRDLWFKRYITQMQIVQFILVIGLHGSGFVWNYVFTGNCHSYDKWFVNSFGMGVIISYLVLFIIFYKTSYSGSGNGKKGRPEGDGKKSAAKETKAD